MDTDEDQSCCSSSSIEAEAVVQDSAKNDEPALPPRRKKRRKLKPADFPDRPLSAYNIFFKEKRRMLLVAKHKREREGGSAQLKEAGVGEVSMVKHISNLWKVISPAERARIEQLAEDDLKRYKVKVHAYELKKTMQARKEREAKMARKEKKRKAQAKSRAPNRSGVDVPAKAAEQQEDTSTKVSPEEDIEDQLDRYLAEEAKALEMARSAKLHQMRLVRQAQISVPELAASLDERRGALGLSPLRKPPRVDERIAGSTEPTKNVDSAQPTGEPMPAPRAIVGGELSSSAGTRSELSAPAYSRLHAPFPQPPGTAFPSRNMNGLARSHSQTLNYPQMLPPNEALRRLDAMYHEEAMLRQMLQNQEAMELNHRRSVALHNMQTTDHAFSHHAGAREQGYLAEREAAYLQSMRGRAAPTYPPPMMGFEPQFRHPGVSEARPLIGVMRPDEARSGNEAAGHRIGP